jgi:hypothetical protein
MGVDIVTYRARISGFVLGNKVESGSAKVWFIGLVILVLVMIGGVETNPGPQVEQVKIDQTLVYVKN